MSSQAQTQAQTQKTIRLKYLYYVKSDKRIAVVLQRNDESSMVAFLDPARIRKVLIVATPFKPSKGEARRGVVVEGDFIYETPLFELKEKQGSVVYPDHVLSYYIIYETSHSYYDSATVEKIGVVLKEGNIELLSDITEFVKPCGKLWRVYLREIGAWDRYCFSLDTVFNIWRTNIHPIYGLMD
jgi:hypothetical protein